MSFVRFIPRNLVFSYGINGNISNFSLHTLLKRLTAT